VTYLIVSLNRNKSPPPLGGAGGGGYTEPAPGINCGAQFALHFGFLLLLPGHVTYSGCYTLRDDSSFFHKVSIDEGADQSIDTVVGLF